MRVGSVTDVGLTKVVNLQPRYFRKCWTDTKFIT
jgi:hypothetical protein